MRVFNVLYRRALTNGTKWFPGVLIKINFLLFFMNGRHFDLLQN